MRVSDLPDSVRDACIINEDDIMREFREFPGTFAYWVFNRSKAQGRVLEADNRVEEVMASVREDIRTDGSKMTVEDMKSMVRATPAVMAACNALVLAKKEEKQLAGIVDALSKKGDMLVSLGAHQRALAKNGGGLDLGEG